MEKLHPGARWQFRIGAYFFLIFLVITTFVFFLSALAYLLKTTGINSIINIIIIAILIYILFIIVFGEIYARLAYNNWFYEFTQDGLRLERGIIWKRYSNIPYERVQNVDVHRGIIARFFGFSSVLIQTAGYSATPYSEGHIPAVDMKRAEEIREFVMKRLKGRH